MGITLLASEELLISINLFDAPPSKLLFVRVRTVEQYLSLQP